jgi:hypothetical protein
MVFTAIMSLKERSTFLEQAIFPSITLLLQNCHILFPVDVQFPE